MDEAQIDGELCCERPGREIGKGEPLAVFGLRDPAPSLDQIAVQYSTRAYRAAETGRPQIEENSGPTP